MISFRHVHKILIVIIVLSLTGCTGTSPKALFFTLSPIDKTTVSKQTASESVNLAIGIGPVTFPDEYDRPSIVTQTGRNQIEINEFHRWAGSLRQNFTRVMTQNLAILLKTDQVMARPWERYFKPDIRITIDIQKFSGQLGGLAELDATWMLIEEGKDVEAVVHRSSIRETVRDESYEALVAAQSLTLARLSEEIVTVLKERQ